MIESIKVFLENWKLSAKEYYQEARNYYKEINQNKEELFPTQYFTSHNGKECSISPYVQMRGHFSDKYGKGTLIMITDKWYNIDEEIEKESKRKYKKLIDTVEKKAGKIIDASGLEVGINMDLNGIVIGENEKVKVETIYAGGYNVQCLHYRTKVNIIK